MWETEAGRQWLTRLVVATLYTFGLKRGVGVDTMSGFSCVCAAALLGLFAYRLARCDAGTGKDDCGDGTGLGEGGYDRRRSP